VARTTNLWLSPSLAYYFIAHNVVINASKRVDAIVFDDPAPIPVSLSFDRAFSISTSASSATAQLIVNANFADGSTQAAVTANQ
jgi:hypothetical protein